MEEEKKNELHTTSVLFEKIKEFEGCRLRAYRCPAGIYSVGYGHTENVKRGDIISLFQAKEYLRQDIAYFEKHVLALGVAKTPPQLDALVDFAFNCGTLALRSSTLLKVIRRGGTEEEIKKEFMRWTKSKGKVLPGLVKRRKWEANRFFENDQR